MMDTTSAEKSFETHCVAHSRIVQIGLNLEGGLHTSMCPLLSTSQEKTQLSRGSKCHSAHQTAESFDCVCVNLSACYRTSIVTRPGRVVCLQILNDFFRALVRNGRSKRLSHLVDLGFPGCRWQGRLHRDVSGAVAGVAIYLDILAAFCWREFQRRHRVCRHLIDCIRR